MRVARAQYQGDPGLLGGIVNFIGGAATGLLSGGPLGAIKGGISSLLPKQTTPVIRSQTPIPQGSALPGTGIQIQLPKAGPSGIDLGGIKAGTFGPAALPSNGFGGVQSGSSSTAPGAKLCIAGHHINKSTYLTRNGIVQAGTACVKNRRMNPLNPRAASRAMRRLDGFSRATRSVEKMMTRIARKNAPRGRAAPARGKKCGCR